MFGLIVVECILTIVLLGSLALYFRTAKQKKDTTKYGALLDLSAIHLVAIPILRGAYLSFCSHPGIFRGNILLLAAVLYLAVLSWDLKYLLTAYRNNRCADRTKMQKRRKTF